MGHDIFGCLPEDRDNDVAYLRRGAGNPLARHIYQAFNAEAHNGGVSGDGGDERYAPEQLRAALARLPNDEQLAPERRFLEDCLAVGSDIIIEFR